MTAWLHAQDLLIGGIYGAADIAAKVKAAMFTDECLPHSHRVTNYRGDSSHVNPMTEG